MKITIVLTSYNYGRYIGRAIRSCLDQSYPGEQMEILVVDDASSDFTKDILRSFGDWIRVIYNQENVGLAMVRNTGIRCATGQYVVCLDADDYLHRDFLKVCNLYLTFNKDHMDAVATDYYLVNDEEEFIERVNVETYPIACGVMYKKDHLVELGLYDDTIGIGEDIDFRLRFFKKYRIGRIDLPLYRYRMHDSNMTRDAGNNAVHLEKVRQKHGLKELASPYIRNNLQVLSK